MNIPILDHGYIKVVEAWGSEERIIEAARMSTGKGFLGWDPGDCPICHGLGFMAGSSTDCSACNGKGSHPGDSKLLRFLYQNQHATPFEFAAMVIEVKAPIMVFREWHRHRTQSYNEMSARYTPLPDENYVPTPDRCLVVNSANKQANSASGAKTLTHESVLEWLGELENAYKVSQACYESGLKRGIPKELARLPVPVARYTRMRAQANLRNWLAFMTLRSAPNAQYEIRQYSDALGSLIAAHFPKTHTLFVEGRS